MRSIGRALVLAGVSFCPTVVLAGAPFSYFTDPYAEVLATLEDSYPSGRHFVLEIFAVSSTDRCPTAELTDGALGPTIRVPNDGRPVSVFLESGEARASGGEDLEVTDGCGGFGGIEDGAAFRLPEEKGGYAVFARALGTGSTERHVLILDPALTQGPGGSLDTAPPLFLGVVNADGVFTVTDQAFPQPQGARGLRDITTLFRWAGMACYPFGIPDDVADVPGATVTEECCDVGETGNGGTAVLLGTCGLEVWDESLQDNTCHTGWLPCVDYSNTETWVFNLPGVGDWLWGLDRDGTRELELRFYPLPFESRL